MDFSVCARICSMLTYAENQNADTRIQNEKDCERVLLNVCGCGLMVSVHGAHKGTVYKRAWNTQRVSEGRNWRRQQ